MEKLINFIMLSTLLVFCSCSTKQDYVPYREYGFSCVDMGNSEEDIKCIDIDSHFDGTDFHKEYPVDYQTWKDL